MFTRKLDNCKFLHDRGDYKSGWQIEKEWDEAQKKKKKKLEASLKGFGDEGLVSSALLLLPSYISRSGGR
jgi:hypothetical protein